MFERKKHKIFARHGSEVCPNDRLSISLIKRSILTALLIQGARVPCEISVLVTNDRNIREINREFRGIDKATDVLSFPMLELAPMQNLTLDGWELFDAGKIEPETGLLPLGEIVISAAQAARQAQEYGHSLEHETAYLTVHSVLHLLGFDHVDEADNKKLMRDAEKAIMRELGFE